MEYWRELIFLPFSSQFVDGEVQTVGVDLLLSACPDLVLSASCCRYPRARSEYQHPEYQCRTQCSHHNFGFEHNLFLPFSAVIGLNFLC